jgi:hypothetical protein
VTRATGKELKNSIHYYWDSMTKAAAEDLKHSNNC